jgi:hypothetical protein
MNDFPFCPQPVEKPAKLCGKTRGGCGKAIEKFNTPLI